MPAVSKDRLLSIILLAAGVLFYLLFAVYDGVYIAVDSESYINMEVSREPLYPAFLAAAHYIFGEAHYLFAAIVIQGILAGFSAWIMAEYLQKRFSLPKALTVLVWFVPLAVSLLCRFAAGRGSMYSNSILTEGICIPLFYIFLRYLLEYCLDQSDKSSFICLILSFVLYSARKQMIIALLLWVVCTVVSHTFAERGRCFRNFWYGALASLCGIGIVLGANLLLEFSYHYVVNGEIGTHTSDSRFIATMAFYTAEESDAQYIEEESVRELFLDIYTECSENGYLMDSAGEGWMERVSHFGDHYDNIQIDTMWSSICSFVQEEAQDDLSSLEINEAADEIMILIAKSVIPHNIGRLLICFSDNFLSGLVNSIAHRSPVLVIYSIAAYLIYVLLLCFCIWQKRRETAVFACLTGLSILVNSAVVSVVIFSQSRYMIYNMSMFYISLLLMFHEAAVSGKRYIRDRKQNRQFSSV